MIKTKIILFALVIFSSTLFSQNNKFIAGATPVYNLPVGTLADRLNGDIGFMFYAGKQISDSWMWIGKFEYFKLSDVNSDQQFVTIQSDVLGNLEEYRFELSNLQMELTVAGFTAEAKYNVFTTDILNVDVNLGFGFYYWEHFRESYNDSLFVDTTGQGDLVLIETIEVPSLTQNDWSGGINIGTDFNFLIFDPIFINLSANYKIIVGELWPTLSLNLENVSGLQFLDFRAGLRLVL